MGNLPQPLSPWRVPRARLDGNTPAVLRFPSGQRLGVKLQVISLTGGLLSVPQPLVEGSRGKLMFLTDCGSVLGGAEMLCPVNDVMQPFRFVSLTADDHRRLGALIWGQSRDNKFEDAWIKKLRAASARHDAGKHSGFSRAVFGLLTLALAAAAYLLQPGLLN
jgi:hypothetical protein